MSASHVALQLAKSQPYFYRELTNYARHSCPMAELVPGGVAAGLLPSPDKVPELVHRASAPRAARIYEGRAQR